MRNQPIRNIINDALDQVIKTVKQEYQLECQDIPIVNPVQFPNKKQGSCCQCDSKTNECRIRHLKKQQQWTVKHTSNNVKDWWDTVTLQHETITPGYGKYPKKGDIVVINYVTKDINGNGLDWSRKPYRFQVGDPSIMYGLNKGIVKLRLGETAKLYIPAEKAYGWLGINGTIKPNTDLIMKITLEKIKLRKISDY